jgi:hypothetical protein
MQASRRAKYWRRCVSPTTSRHELHVTASIGIVTYPDDGTDVETLMKKADSAMYHAKENGRDSFQFFRSEMSAKAIERQSLEASLRHAIERQELELHYQPKLDLASGEVIGCRGAHPVAPPAARARSPRTVHRHCGGLRAHRTHWPMGAARSLPPGARLAGCGSAAAEHRGKHFRSGVACAGFRIRRARNSKRDGPGAALSGTGADRTALMDDSRSVSDVLKELKDIGVLLALDDFGTGYSSLTHLKRFPDRRSEDRSVFRARPGYG